MSKILVTGATGGLGNSVVKYLVEKVPASDVTVLVRDAAKAKDLADLGVEIRIGDYSDYASLVKAFSGVNKLYFVSGSDVPNRNEQHKNVVNAAKEAGVGHVVYTSFQRKNETESSPLYFLSQSHLNTEKWLRESGLPYTIMKHALYTDGLPMFLGEKVLETGVYQPAGEGKASYTLREDMAEAGAVVLTTPGHENKSYEISADTAYSYADIAALLGEVTGKPVGYISPSASEYREALTKAGVPDVYVGIFAGFAEAIKQGEFENYETELEKLLGRKPGDVKSYLKQVYA